ncbi:serine/threonine-protein kinase [Yinghuangia soli]|uniref:Serine/threonine protein kinase n=1 Tax=Yinghuangia soli TaxID=2908204 RepID=A0AA41U9K7_9ACTN|nr:serine/threonine protein kinase [Yinghuangia soli]
MGTVFAAVDRNGRQVAVKVIHPGYAGDHEFRARFRREVALTSRVTGPCLVPVLAADCDAERPWLATPYIPGPTIQRHIAEHGPLAGAMLFALASGVAAALASIHAAGVIHRDIKPGNVILSPDGPRLLDFGISHALDGTSVTHTGILTGTPGWISPEQYQSGTSGTASDVFAWGALLAYAGTGRHPFGTGAPDAVAFRVLTDEPDLSGLPEDLYNVAAAALAKDPACRPAASALHAVCVTMLSNQLTAVPGPQLAASTLVDAPATHHFWSVPAPDDVWPAPRRPSRARALWAAAAVAAATVAVAGTAVVLAAALDGHQEPQAEPPSSTSSTTASPVAAAPGEGVTTLTPTSPAPSATTTEPAARPATTAATPREPAEPQPAYTRSDPAEPTTEEWAAARDTMTASERAIAATINEDLATFLRDDWDLPEGVRVTFNPKAQTMFLTVGPSPVVWNNGGDYTELRRALMFSGCSYGNEKIRADSNWPYGRVVVVYRESMATAVIADYREVTRGMSCRV